MIGCESIMNWKGIIEFCNIKFYVGRDGVTGCESDMNWKQTLFYKIIKFDLEDYRLSFLKDCIKSRLRFGYF